MQINISIVKIDRFLQRMLYDTKFILYIYILWVALFFVIFTHFISYKHIEAFILASS